MSYNGSDHEIGRVVTPGQVAYRLFADNHWEVSHAGRRMPASEASISMFYAGFEDVPGRPGEGQLCDLARRTHGTLIWTERIAASDGEV